MRKLVLIGIVLGVTILTFAGTYKSVESYDRQKKLDRANLRIVQETEATKLHNGNECILIDMYQGFYKYLEGHEGGFPNEEQEKVYKVWKKIEKENCK